MFGKIKHLKKELELMADANSKFELEIEIIQQEKQKLEDKMIKLNMDHQKLKDELLLMLDSKNDFTLKLINDYQKLINTNEIKIQEFEKENLKLKEIIKESPKKLSSLNTTVIRNKMADEAWYGGNSREIYVDLDGNPVIEFYGHTYEPGYESFSSTCTVYGFDRVKNKIILFDEDDYSTAAYLHKVKTTGSNEIIDNYINEHDCYVILQKQ